MSNNNWGNASYPEVEDVFVRNATILIQDLADMMLSHRSRTEENLRSLQKVTFVDVANALERLIELQKEWER